MIDPTTVVTLVRTYLAGSTGTPHAGRANTAGAALVRLLQDGLVNVAPLRDLEQGIGDNRLDPHTEDRLRRVLAHAFATVPQFAARVDELAGHVQREQAPVRAPQEQVSAGGTSSSTNDQQVRYDHVQVGGNLATSVTNKSRNTKIAVGGGGAVLAATALFIWHQYSSGAASEGAVHNYQRLVVATCAHIKQDGTGQVPLIAVRGGLGYRRSDVLHQLAVFSTVSTDETAQLMAHPAPAGLADDRASVQVAQVRVARAAAVAGHRIVHVLPATFTQDQSRAAQDDPAFVEFTAAERHFGDALTVLAGSDCAVGTS